MADRELLNILRQGVAAWNQWREDNPDEYVDFTGAHISGVSVDLEGSNFCKVDFNGATLSFSNLKGANLSEANLPGVFFLWTNLSNANLTGACLNGANLTGADLSGADLTGTDLIGTILVDTNLEKSILNGCRVYGLSAWGLKLKDAIQKDLIITPFSEPVITVDNLEVAQFIYLLLHNEKIRDVIDTVAKKVVLILGRFTDTRKPLLIAIKDRLRDFGYLPVLFDFRPPAERNTLETITLLARLARFIIVDITEPQSVPQELVSIVPALPSVPVKPILQEGHDPWGMFDAIRCYPWVLEIYYYSNTEGLLDYFEENIIIPSVAKANELRNRL